MSDNRPSTSWAVWAWQAYQKGRLVESHALPADPRVEKLVEALRELVHHAHNCEKELTEKLHHEDFCGESLPLTIARAAIASWGPGMSDAPERIWADGNQDWDSGSWGLDKEFDDDVEYLRADLIAAARRDGWNAAIEAAAKVAEEQAEWVPIKQGDMSKAILAMKETDQ
jgi:hypothetical protein